MKWFNNQNFFIKYLICLFLLFILLFFIRKITLKTDTEFYMPISEYTKSNIYMSEEKYIINVDYPKFKNKELNKIITDWVYTYVKNFREDSEKSSIKNKLTMDYSLYFIEEYVNVFFNVNNSLNLKDISKSMFLNMKDNKLSNITELYSPKILEKEISNVKNKYPSNISDLILKENVNTFDYLIDDNGYNIYFTNVIKNIEVSYIPELRINTNTKSVNEYVVDNSKPMVALTFDDGPSLYTLDILKCLELNDAKATFFELGIKMKQNKEIVKKLYDNKMEIGNHSYSHKYLTKLSISEALEEVNSTTILFNEITSASINLMRVPYGSINSNLRKNIPFPIIGWSIDTKDWLYKNPEKSFSIVMNNISDGDIILMHDVHYTTIELVKMIVPELKAKGYELVTISELAAARKHNLEPGVIIREIK